MKQFAMANRFYCPKCRSTFFMPQSQGYKHTVAVYCPVCGEKKAEYTSDDWWTEKNKICQSIGA